ncbi:hypothetical protein Leryth_013804, partial [Lithospermum erythrorhizon]
MQTLGSYTLRLAAENTTLWQRILCTKALGNNHAMSVTLKKKTSTKFKVKRSICDRIANNKKII